MPPASFSPAGRVESDSREIKRRNRRQDSPRVARRRGQLCTITCESRRRFGCAGTGTDRVVYFVDRSRTQNGHIRNDTRDVSRRGLGFRSADLQVNRVASDRACPRVTPGPSMVRRGSTVRVRQRASRKASKWPFLLPQRVRPVARLTRNLSPRPVPSFGRAPILGLKGSSGTTSTSVIGRYSTIIAPELIAPDAAVGLQASPPRRAIAETRRNSAAAAAAPRSPVARPWRAGTAAARRATVAPANASSAATSRRPTRTAVTTGRSTAASGAGPRDRETSSHRIRSAAATSGTLQRGRLRRRGSRARRGRHRGRAPRLRRRAGGVSRSSCRGEGFDGSGDRLVRSHDASAIPAPASRVRTASRSSNQVRQAIGPATASASARYGSGSTSMIARS